MAAETADVEAIPAVATTAAETIAVAATAVVETEMAAGAAITVEAPDPGECPGADMARLVCPKAAAVTMIVAVA